MRLIDEKLEEKFREIPIESQDEKLGNAEVIAKFFNPTGVGSWYITEGNKLENGDYEMFGYCHLGDDENAEFGTIYLSELRELRLPMGMNIERDLYFPDGLDLVQALKRDGIKPHEYLLENYKEKENKMKDKLQNKIEKEYKDFIEELKTHSPKEIIDRAYEKVCKEEMMYTFSKLDLQPKEYKALLKFSNILDDCYDEWLKSDGNFNEMLEYAVENSVEHIVADYKRAEKKKDVR